MAKYYVSKKRTSRGVIESLIVHLVDTVRNTFAAGEVWTRHRVVTEIEAGNTFYTITPSRTAAGKWDVGAQINIFPVTVEYLKTAQNNQPGDNLDNLPDF